MLISWQRRLYVDYVHVMSVQDDVGTLRTAVMHNHIRVIPVLIRHGARWDSDDQV